MEPRVLYLVFVNEPQQAAKYSIKTHCHHATYKMEVKRLDTFGSNNFKWVQRHVETDLHNADHKISINLYISFWSKSSEVFTTVFIKDS